MIQVLASKYQKHIAYSFLLLFYTVTALPVYGMRSGNGRQADNFSNSYAFNKKRSFAGSGFAGEKNTFKEKAVTVNDKPNREEKETANDKIEKADIGGPTQPEMSRFKSAGADNLVNLFTGDFSYNIPLLDVGGYPVNIFYDGGITPEQEASWVGLGWNINPGTISRNMRGVPDDFDGTEELVTTQSMKPNITWGARLKADFEAIGIKKLPGNLGSINATFGVSVNNYLGPALDYGGGVSFDVTKLVAGEKNAADLPFKIGAGINANLSSRGGLTIAPNVSLSASKEIKYGQFISGGIGMSTSYNSRTGISNLNLDGQFSLNRREQLYKCNEKNLSERGGYHHSTISPHLLSTSISFAKPSYNPGIRMPITNEAHAGHFQLGGGLWGLYVSGEAEVYRQASSVEDEDMKQTKPMVGYLYYQNANANANAVVDFTRFNDKEVTPHTPIISVPQYSYDVFSINGEGTGGSIRLYRNDYGYVRDNYTRSRDKSLSAGADVGIPGHFGANVNVVRTHSTISEWDANNKIRDVIPFSGPGNGTHENVYFRNPGETSVLNNNQFQKIGGTDLVRFKLGGSSMNPSIEPVLERFSSDYNKLADINLAATNNLTGRKKRTQVVSYLTAAEASVVGLNKVIKSYNATSPLKPDNTLNYFEPTIPRVDDDIRKPHHISQITVTEANGSRYVYDLPVYNLRQRDLTFTVGSAISDADNDLVSISTSDISKGGNGDFHSNWLASNSRKDGYLQVNETPAYAHSFLLGGLLSPDYVDVTNNGITEDDLGNAVKFNYTRIDKFNGGENPAVHRWRTPLGGQANTATLNAGNRSEDKDDKGLISYGERESWYLHSIESKTMIALFTLENRQDAKGPKDDEFGGRDINDNSSRRLQKIDLYSKADLKKNGLTGNNRARPIKSVFFEYSYKLCANSPDNSGNLSDPENEKKGKLTLERIYFTFNGQNRANKNQYKFVYENPDNTGNPAYEINSSDRWGNYKSKLVNPTYGNQQQLRNADYPYSFQPINDADKNTVKLNAAAWNLKKILLPSGGQIEVEYESDDYAFVQNRRAATMMNVAGFSKNNASYNDNLYSHKFLGFEDHFYVRINVPMACTSQKEVYLRYLQGQKQLAFRLAVQMPKGIEYLTSYGEIDYGLDKLEGTTDDEYGFVTGSAEPQIWVKLKSVNDVIVAGNTVKGLSPLSITALEFLKEQLPGQAFAGYDVSEGTTLKQFGEMIKGLIKGLENAFSDPINAMRRENKARYTDLARCFVRLNDPDGYKYGGGHRVKKVTLKDNWKKMTHPNPNDTKGYTSEYGQVYDYTTTEVFNGTERIISSGVASYEPSIGGEENPFQTMVQFADRLPLGPRSYGAVEMPVLDAFFEAPVVGYSKVTVRSLKRNPQAPKDRSAVGRQVTEFYTAKDFPVYYEYTPLDPAISDIKVNMHEFGAFFWKWSFDSRAISQGFLVATNDMHGKMKSQSSYAENDPLTRISYTENFYRNTGVSGLNETFEFADGLKGGVIRSGNMGIDIELMTDTREFSVKTISQELQAQLDDFPIIAGLPWLPFFWKVKTKSENIYRAVTCTKVINYHSIVDKVVVIDKGSKVSTENLVYDAETGDVIVNRTNNEFDKPIYTVNYPAYWAYSGMGLAYKNINAVYTGINFYDGKMTNGGGFEQNDIESGDELYILETGSPATGCVYPSPADIKRIWAIDKNKHTTSLTVPVKDLVYLDEYGQLYSRNGVKIRIIRSGKRNMLDAQAASITMMDEPWQTEVAGEKKLVIKADANFNNKDRVINAGAVEYKEKWQTDNDVFKRYVTVDVPPCGTSETENCEGYLEKNINPYCKGLLGNFKANRSFVFYDGRTGNAVTASETDISNKGYLTNFNPYWNFNAANLVPDQSNTKWVWNSEATAFNARGFELETKNALEIYTAAQYGYHKTMPIAITNNSRSNEAFFEGFEDMAFDNTLSGNTNATCANKKHVNLLPPADVGGLVDANESGVNAHTGRYMLGVNSQKTFSKTFDIKRNLPETYPLQFGQKTDKFLSEYGYNYSFGPPIGDPLYLPSIPPSIGGSQAGYGIEVLLSFDVNSDKPSYTAQTDYDFYINVTTAKTYNFKIILNGEALRDISACSTFHNVLDVRLTNISTNSVVTPPMYVEQYKTDPVYKEQNFSVFLCPGIYHVKGTARQSYANPTYPQDGYYSYTWLCPEEFVFYKSVNTTDGCTYTTPIPGAEEMLSSLFAPGSSKMLLSTWVKETCASTPCNATSYNANSIQIDFNSGTDPSPLTPAGPIIEGWQRYEGVITVPDNATTMTMKLVNSSSGTIYFDDIRMHPFNANMTSYVYDPVSLRLTAQLDANNYATFYEYDAEGGLIRTKTETKEGVKTINETRSAKQKGITEVVQ